MSFLSEAVISKNYILSKLPFAEHCSYSWQLVPSTNMTFTLNSSNFVNTKSGFIFLFIRRLLQVPVETIRGKYELNNSSWMLKPPITTPLNFFMEVQHWRSSLIHLRTQAGEMMPWQGEGTCRKQERNLHAYLVSVWKKGRKLLLAWELLGLWALRTCRVGETRRESKQGARSPSQGRDREGEQVSVLCRWSKSKPCMWWEGKDFLGEPGPGFASTHRATGLQERETPSQAESEDALLDLSFSLSWPAVVRSLGLEKIRQISQKRLAIIAMLEESSPLILSIFRHGVTPPAQPLSAVKKQLSLSPSISPC